MTPTKQDIVSLDISHRRIFRYGQVDIGLGFEQRDDIVTNKTTIHVLFYNGAARTSSCDGYWYNPPSQKVLLLGA